jgi:hypothetical protein
MAAEYNAKKVESCLRHIDLEMNRLQEASDRGVDVYELWTTATPESLGKLQEMGIIRNAKALADSMDYCAEHYARWEKEQQSDRSYDSEEYEYNGKNSFKTRAAFQIGGRWKWVTWVHEEPNKHAAIIEKAKELGASRWDYGNADHAFVSEANF